MNLSELRTDVRALVGDPTYGGPEESPTVYNTTEVDKAINNAINMLAIQLECTFVFDALDVVGSGLFALPTDRLFVRHVLYNNKPLDRSTLEFENLVDPNWRNLTPTTTPNPKRYVLEGALVHVVGNPTSGVTCGYLQKTNDLIDPTDPVDERIPEFYHSAIKYAAGAALYSLDTESTDLQIATEFMNRFQSLITGGRPSNLNPTQAQ